MAMPDSNDKQDSRDEEQEQEQWNGEDGKSETQSKWDTHTEREREWASKIRPSNPLGENEMVSSICFNANCALHSISSNGFCPLNENEASGAPQKPFAIWISNHTACLINYN